MNLRTIGLLAILALLLFITARVLADVKSVRIKMKMSETSIEKVEEVAGSIDGVIQTSWDKETQELEIVFQQDKTSLRQIEKTISRAGFDTPNYKASKEDTVKLIPERNESEASVK